MFAALYGYCDESEIIEALRAGQACDRFDMLFLLNELRVLIDYDGGYYHGENRLVRDRQKCLDALADHPNSLVVRVRIKAIPIQIEHDRVLVIDVDTDRNEAAVYQVAQALSTRVSEPWSRNLRNIRDQKRPVCDQCCVDVLKTIAKTFEQEIEVLQSILNPAHVATLLEIHGMKTGLRLGKLSCQIRELHTRGIRGDKLVSFMCDGVASALLKNPDAFWKGIATLDARGIKGEKLVSLMCGGVASALVQEPTQFFETIQSLTEARFSLEKVIMLCRETARATLLLQEVLRIGPLITRSQFRSIGRKRKSSV